MGLSDRDYMREPQQKNVPPVSSRFNSASLWPNFKFRLWLIWKRLVKGKRS